MGAVSLRDDRPRTSGGICGLTQTEQMSRLGVVVEITCITSHCRRQAALFMTGIMD